MKPKKLFWSLIFILIILGSLCFAACGDIEFKIRFYETYNSETGYGKQLEIIEVGEEGEFEMPENPTRSGYVFEGWHYLLSGAETSFTAETEIRGNISIYAKWRQLPFAPANFKFNKNTDPTVLSWTAVSGAERYEIALTESQKDSESDLIVIDDPSVTTYVVTAYGEYAAYIRTVAENGDKSAWSKNAVVFTIEAPRAYVTFKDGEYTYGVAVEIVDGKVVLPPNPANTESKRFLGWFDAGGTVEFDENNAGNSDINVYAKWDNMPIAPSISVSMRYEPNKANGSQKVSVTDNVNLNVKSYTLIITDADGNEIYNITQTGKTFVLTGTYIEDEEYEATLIITSNNQWYVSLSATEKADMTALYEGFTFEYQVLDPSSYTVDFMSGDDLIERKAVTEGSLIKVPDTPFKEGYKFLGWFTTKEGSVSFDFTKAPTGDVRIYAKYEEFARPSSLAYDKDTKKIVWSEVEGCTYEFALTYADREDPQKINENFIIHTTVGSYNASVRAVDSAGNRTAWRAATFSIIQVSVTFKVDGLIYETVPINLVNDCIDIDKLPADPANTLDRRFMGWYLNQAGTTRFENENLTANITVYAKWDNKPVVVPKAVSLLYTSAKEGLTQYISITDDVNEVEYIEKYIIRIYSDPARTVLIEELTITDFDSMTAVLREEYTVDAKYYFTVIVVSVNEWYIDLDAEEKTPMTAVSSANFTYAIIPQDKYKVTLRDGTTGALIGEPFTVTEGSLIAEPDIPFKNGFKFVKWVTEQSGSVEFDFDALITKDTVIYASYISFAAPTGLTYNTATKKIEWNEVENCTYELALTYAQRENPEGLDENYYYYITAGNYTAYVRAVDTNLNKSAWGVVEFSITQVFVTFMNEGKQYGLPLLVNLATDKLDALPLSPDSNAARYFLGWVDGEGNEFDYTLDTVTEDLMLYADWEYPPVVTAPNLVYHRARLTGTQKLTWSGIEGAEKYVIEIYDNLGVKVQDGVVLASSVKEFILSGDYAAGFAYTAKIKTVMVEKWHGYTLESAWQALTFTYEVLPNAQITFMVGDNEYTTRTTSADGTLSVLPPVPTKDGYVFSKWVTAGGVTYTGQKVLENTTVFAEWTTRPQAPQSVLYTDGTLTLSWEAVTGVELYQYRIDSDQTVRTVTGTSLQLFGLTAGEHKIYFKITVGDIESEWSEVTFTVTAVYIKVNQNNGTVDYVPVEGGKISTPAIPVWSGYQFVKWSLDSLDVLYEGNPGGTSINFNTYIFDKTTQIYAQWYEKPAEITGVQWSEGSGDNPDALTIADSADAHYYNFKWAEDGIVTKLTGKILDLSTLHLPEGQTKIYIQSVKVINNVDVKSIFKEVSFTVGYTAQLTRYSDGLIKEVDASGKTTYIFYAGFTYELANTVFETNDTRYTFPSSGNSGKIRFTNVLGDFELKFEYGGAARTWNAKVVPYVSFLNYDNSYANYFSSSAIEGDSIFIGKGNPYEVGIGGESGNYFIDLSTGTSGFTFKQDLLNLTIKFQYEDSEGLRTDAPYFSAVYNSATDRYVLNYTGNVSGAIGKTLIITVSAKYLNHTQYEQIENYTVEFKLKLNDGVNVYTNAQLKTAFADTSIKKINLHSDITAEFAADQVNSDGTAVNYIVGDQPSAVKADGNYIYSVKTYDLAKYLDPSLSAKATENDCLSVINSATSALRRSAIETIGRRVIAANVYYRFLTNQDDNLVVNGNYFTIDSGSVENELRKVNNTAEGWTQVWYGQAASNMVALDKVQNVQTAMFLVQNMTQGTIVNVTYNNLEIDGNTKLIGNDSASITLYSGGMNGFMARRSTINCNNTVAREFTIGYFLHHYDNVKNNYNYITDSIADINWSNGIYSYGAAAITLRNSRLLRCSGAAIHIEDTDEGRNTYASIIYNNTETGVKIPLYDNSTNRTAEVRRDPALIIYTDTKIENWITGEEAWFTAWGVSAMIPGLKTNLQDNAQTLFGQSVIKMIDGVEKVNLALIMRPKEDSSQMEVCIKDKNGINPDIEYTLASNTAPEENVAHTLPYNNDPRYQSATINNPIGMLLTPIGKTTDTVWAAQAGAYATYRVYLASVIAGSGGTITSMEGADAYVRSNPSAHPSAYVQYLALETAYTDKLGATLKTQIAALCQNLSYNVSQITASMPAVLYYECVNMSSGVAAKTVLNNLGISGGNAVNIGGSQFFQLAMSGADIGAGTASGPNSLAYIWLSYGNGDGWYSGS